MRSGLRARLLGLQWCLRVRRARLRGLVPDTALNRAIVWASACDENPAGAVAGGFLADAGSAGRGAAFVHAALVVSGTGAEA